MLNLPNIKRSQETSKNENLLLYKGRKKYDYFSMKIPYSIIEQRIKSIKDERFLFFIKYGILRRFDGDCETIYIEIPQIPKKIVIYRRPYARMKSSDKLNLSKKDLPHIPLFEGEDNLKYLSLELNQISKIEQLISLNNLIYLNLYGNKISEIENLQCLPKLKILLIGRNFIDKIKNLNSLIELEILDLHSNKIKVIENISHLKKLRILNLANNLINSIKELMSNINLEEVNLRKNLIEFIPNLKLDKIKKFNLGKNLISKLESLFELKKLKNLEELNLEDNPILEIKEALMILRTLPIEDQLKYCINKNINNSNSLVFNKENKTFYKIDKKKLNLSKSAIQIQSEKINKINIKIIPIKLLWKDEFNKIIQLGYNGYCFKRYKEINIYYGYVETINENTLIFYGNCTNEIEKEDFKKNFSYISFNYFYFNVILNKKTIDILNQYKNLISISFNDNNIYSFYQITKLENIDFIQCLNINQNEICNSSLLKYFIIYRLQNLKYFNDIKITEKDKILSNKFFVKFDKKILENENKKKINSCENQIHLNKNNEINNKLKEINNKNKFFTFIKKNLSFVLYELFSEKNYE